MKKRYTVLGMSCAACASAVERAASSVDSVLSAEVSLMTNALTVTLPEGPIDEQPLFDAVKKAGYTLTAYRPEKVGAKEKRGFLFYRLLFSLVLLLPLFYVAMGQMLHLPYPDFLTEWKINVLCQIALTLPIVVLNFKFFVVGYPRLFRGHPNMDSLVALGCTASLAYSVYACVMLFAFGRSEYSVYFESAGMILSFITIGKYMEARTKKKTGEAIAGLLALAPEEATVLRGGVETSVPASEVAVGEIILVRPGTSVPADGCVLSGESAIDESAMTGESIPRDIAPGARVMAGTVNLTGAFTFKAEKVAGDTSLQAMVRLVEEASAGKAPVGRLADKIAGIFVPAVMAIALLASSVWLFATKDFETALRVCVSVLVIACPCSLGLATPAAIMAGTGKGAEIGVIFRSAAALESCGKVDTVVFDKTGTITEGKPSVTALTVREGDRQTLLLLLSSLEAPSEHPIARAIVKSAEDEGIVPLPCTDFSALPGKGVSGTVDGRKLYALSLEEASKRGFVPTKAEREAISGKTAVVLFEGERPLGIAALLDMPKPDASAAVEALKKEKISCVLLSGDRRESAEAVGRLIGIDEVFSEVLPDRKERKIAELCEKGRIVAMVGDGINDAPALARADVGFALGSGTDIAICSADVVLMTSHPFDVCAAIALSRRTLQIIKQNLFFAFFYNCVGIGLAVSGIADPIIAAAAMSLSSFCVLTNALRLRHFDKMKITGAECTVTPEAYEMKNEQTETEEKTAMTKRTLDIEGMMCMHCVAHVKKALEALAGVTGVEVSLEKNNAEVTTDGSVSDEALAKAVNDEGYTVVRVH